MKYPKRPFFIAYNKYEQLWLIIPLCILGIFVKGCGIVGSVVFILIWLFISIKDAEHVWIDACNRGYATNYCDCYYLEKQGFYEVYMVGVFPVSEKEVLQKEIENEVKELKEELERLIINNHSSIINTKEEREEHFKKKELYKIIMGYYGVKRASLPKMETAYNILIKGGDLYKTVDTIKGKMLDNKYLLSFQED